MLPLQAPPLVSESEGRPHVLSGVFDLHLELSNFHLQNVNKQNFKKKSQQLIFDHLLFACSRLCDAAPA